MTARGRGGSHKGHRRVFTNPEELAARNERRDREREWRKARGEDESSEDEDKDGEEESGSEESSSDDGSDKESKAKGVEALIEIENPNRAPPKPAKKAVMATDKPDAKPVEVQLSRREREEIEKQRARDAYNKLHAEGKTEQARADLARLALIRQQREDAAKKKEQEKVAKEGSAKAAAVNKVAATKSVVSTITASSAPNDGDG